MSCPSHSSWLDHPNYVWWGVQSIKLLIMQSSPLPCYLIPLGGTCYMELVSYPRNRGLWVMSIGNLYSVDNSL
jgi:hypothetical protein